VALRFTPSAIGNAGGFYEGSLTIASNDTDESNAVVQLAGFWQEYSELGQEPDLLELNRVFGYGTTIVGPGQTVNNGGRLLKAGDEVHSAYWRRADTSRPLAVRQLAAYHTQGNVATIRLYDKASTAEQTVLTHWYEDGQTVLPRLDTTVNGVRGPAERSVTPNWSIFGFEVDDERSDWKQNMQDSECVREAKYECGHHVRFWPAKDHAGRLMPNTFLMGMDYAGINYDFNDNLYLVSNVAPEDPANDPNRCSPVACDKVVVSSPLDLGFAAAVPDTVDDKDGQGTGLTWIDPPTTGSGYRPAGIDLDAAAGALRLTTTAGSSVGTPNELDNALGVGLRWGSTPRAITTTLVDPPAGTGQAQQAGLWFGRGQDDYVKLATLSTFEGTRLQFAKEENGVLPDGADVQSPIVNLDGKTAELKLVADPVARRVSASYRIDGGGSQPLGSVTVPASFFAQDPALVDPRTQTSSYAGLAATHRSGPSAVTYTFGEFRIGEETPSGPRPSVVASRPADNATGVVRDTSLATDLSLPNGGVDNSTLDASSVRLVRDSDGAPVPVTRGTSGGGDTVVVTPSTPLEANTRYRFEITDALRDVTGAPFVPYTARFTTGAGFSDDGNGSSSAAFDKVALPTATSPYSFYSSLVVGPDGMLYAGMVDGRIRRFAIQADGTLGAGETITTLVPKFSVTDDATKRLLVGMRFDPASTAANPILWVSHTTFGFENMPDWGGKITRLSGTDLAGAQDFVTGLPRSVRDHVTNGLSFGPDGKLYVLQGSNSAMGASDVPWGERPERTLSAALLRVDPAKISAPPLNVKTAEGGTYDPFAADAPVTVHASGIRNAYDLVFHSNGNLYVPTNGSAAGGNTPGSPSTLPSSCSKRIDSASRGAYTGPSVPGITNVTDTQHDFLFRVEGGGYYGHPNPARCEWVLNGGDPTSATDESEVGQYLDGTRADRNWRGASCDFGRNKSPNGVIEYTGDGFGGSLKGKLLVVRYSQNDDIIALTPGGTSGDIVASQTQIPGLSGFKDPIDLVEDPRTGNIYVSEYDQLGTDQRITLLRPRESTTPTACAPYSSATCADVKKPVPHSHTFTGAEGGVGDKDGDGTGFTMAQPSSNGGAYLPGRLDVVGGNLTITSTEGIQYKTPSTTRNGNSQDNALGVGVGATGQYRVQTTLVRPPKGTGSSEQAGLWLGPDEDTYLKLVVASVNGASGPTHRVQLLREVAGAADYTADERNLYLGDLSQNDVSLTLELDALTRTAQGWLSVDGGAPQSVGVFSDLPAAMFDGSTLSAGARSAGIRTFAGIFASHRNATSTLGLAFTFSDFGVLGEAPQNRAPTVADPGDRTNAEGDEVNLPISASDPDGDVLAYTATGLPAGLSISSSTGVISGRLASTAGRTEPYAVTVTATDDGTPAAAGSVSFRWTVDEPATSTFDGVKVNFQSPAATVPAGHVRDFGQAYGSRTSANQGSGLSYGWIDPVTGAPLDLSVGGAVPGNGRERNAVSDQRLDTLMHMQADDVVGTFNGTPREGAWELRVPDGDYRVTVAVGDPDVGADSERHTVTVEDVRLVNGFIPSGPWGSSTRTTVRTLDRVTVSDGHLTLDPVGGFNTKIEYAEIMPLAAQATVTTLSTTRMRAPTDQVSREGDAVAMTLAAPDAPDGVRYDARRLPDGVRLDQATGELSGTIAEGAARPRPYELIVSAGGEGDRIAKESFSWSIGERARVTQSATRPAAPDDQASGGDRPMADQEPGPATTERPRPRSVVRLDLAGRGGVYAGKRWSGCSSAVRCKAARLSRGRAVRLPRSLLLRRRAGAAPAPVLATVWTAARRGARRPGFRIGVPVGDGA
jgi:hypothetical protein